MSLPSLRLTASLAALGAAALALAAVLWLAAVHRYGQERLAVSG